MIRHLGCLGDGDSIHCSVMSLAYRIKKIEEENLNSLFGELINMDLFGLSPSESQVNHSTPRTRRRRGSALWTHEGLSPSGWPKWLNMLLPCVSWLCAATDERGPFIRLTLAKLSPRQILLELNRNLFIQWPSVRLATMPQIINKSLRILII